MANIIISSPKKNRIISVEELFGMVAELFSQHGIKVLAMSAKDYRKAVASVEEYRRISDHVDTMEDVLDADGMLAEIDSDLAAFMYSLVTTNEEFLGQVLNNWEVPTDKEGACQ